VIFALLLLISIIDIRQRRIPNLCILLLLLISLATLPQTFEPILLLSSVLISLLFHLISKCGLGDVKLVIVIVNCVVGGSNVSRYFAMVCVISGISIAIHYMRTRSMKGEIAFAPALCGAVLVVRPLSIL
jgi:Flp pilus assembly protein protease CpaA